MVFFQSIDKGTVYEAYFLKVWNYGKLEAVIKFFLRWKKGLQEF